MQFREAGVSGRHRTLGRLTAQWRLTLRSRSGAWAQLFRKAAGYLETLLLQDQAVSGRFLTIDRWSSQSAHDAFLAEFHTEYETLDLACESLTQRETSLGSYRELMRPEA